MTSVSRSEPTIIAVIIASEICELHSVGARATETALIDAPVLAIVVSCTVNPHPTDNKRAGHTTWFPQPWRSFCGVAGRGTLTAGPKPSVERLPLSLD